MHKGDISLRALIVYLVVIVGIIVGGYATHMEFVAVVSLLIFVTSIFLIATEILSRSAAALLGALLVFLFFLAYGAMNPAYAEYTPKHLVHYIELDTILTLMGIIIVASLGLRSGLFYWIGMKVAKASRGDPIKLYFILAVFSYFLNVFLIAVATIVVVVSLTLAICDILKIDPRPYILMEIFIVNVGASSSMISAVPNIIIADKAGLSFVFFIQNLLPFTTIFFLMSLWLLYRIAAPSPEIDLRRSMAILEVDEWWFVKNKVEFYVSAISIMGLIIGFMVSPELMVISWIFAVVSLSFYSKPDELLKDVDWDTLLFFVGFYVVVASLEISGVLSSIAEGLVLVAGGNPTFLIILLFIISVIISGFVDNIPYVLVLIPIAEEILRQPSFEAYSVVFWAMVILACNIGGALNPYSAPQNLLAISLARKAKYDISLPDYYKVSLRWILLGSLMAVVYGLAVIYTPVIISAVGFLVFIVIVLSLVSIVVLFVIHKLLGFKYVWGSIKLMYKNLKGRVKNLLQEISQRRYEGTYTRGSS